MNNTHVGSYSFKNFLFFFAERETQRERKKERKRERDRERDRERKIRVNQNSFGRKNSSSEIIF